MKLSTLLAASIAASSVGASPAPVEKRHYTFPALTGSSDWQYVRQTTNYQSNSGLADVTSDQIRCYQAGTTGAKASQIVAAGSSVGFKASPNIFHPGPLQFYMAKVPSGEDAATWDGKGQVWFKIYTEKPTSSGGQLSWASLNKGTVSVTIPKSVPSGDYLLRVEHIALHMASAVGGAQFYISCAQVKVTGGGSGSPSPLVSFPGAYSSSDPGIKINIYSGATSYTPPGPPVWQG
ncbi:hypothetical protein G7Y89_g8620 [Cudoniella acicularis]|uniref:lytic cellulose monooxygenase (C4-dehydrogenating) n=1 Tax=Cudoniella acicularis TaxID=354080 RepID=A0A8H4RG87_9HELO|nr:hypothetical protein G7Y89_g8620 [Cudoniella acicularis]